MIARSPRRVGPAPGSSTRNKRYGWSLIHPRSPWHPEDVGSPSGVCGTASLHSPSSVIIRFAVRAIARLGAARVGAYRRPAVAYSGWGAGHEFHHSRAAPNCSGRTISTLAIEQQLRPRRLLDRRCRPRRSSRWRPTPIARRRNPRRPRKLGRQHSRLLAQVARQRSCPD